MAGVFEWSGIPDSNQTSLKSIKKLVTNISKTDRPMTGVKRIESLDQPFGCGRLVLDRSAALLGV